jgi:hypothetical protein
MILEQSLTFFVNWFANQTGNVGSPSSSASSGSHVTCLHCAAMPFSGPSRWFRAANPAGIALVQVPLQALWARLTKASRPGDHREVAFFSLQHRYCKRFVQEARAGPVLFVWQKSDAIWTEGRTDHWRGWDWDSVCLRLVGLNQAFDAAGMVGCQAAGFLGYGGGVGAFLVVGAHIASPHGGHGLPASEAGCSTSSPLDCTVP